MASYDKAIPPGGEGKITVRIKTNNVKGKIKKSLRVYANDPASASEILTVTASIRPILDVNPRSVYLKGNEDETQSAEVIITGTEERPLMLEVIYFDLIKIVEYSIETVEENKIYKLSFHNLPGADKKFKGKLKLKTNYPEKPEILINIRGRFVN